MFKKILTFFIFWKLIIIAFTFLGIYLLPLDLTYTVKEYKEKLPYFAWVFSNFDGYYYLKIAEIGYENFQNPYFPLYPLLIRTITLTNFFSYATSAFFISNIAFIFSLYLCLKLLGSDQLQKFKTYFLLIVFLFPTSFFYNAAYNDSLFLLFSVLTIFFARKKIFSIASLFGGLATLTRLNGLALFFFLIFEYLFEENKFSPLFFIKALKEKFNLNNILKEKLYLFFIIPLAFISYLAYTEIFYGDWHLVFSSMKLWNQDKIVFPFQVFWRYFKIMFIFELYNWKYWIAILELSFIILYSYLMIFSFNRIRLSYWILFFVSILIPSLTGTFQGMPRYGLHLYPFFLSLVVFITEQKKIFRIIYFTLSFLLFAFYIILFTRGYFVA